ncbi:hypothetical protein [Neolewinella agarilytica]|nr:hypothetical protein [Neolewinella agarilytica]
MFYHNGEINVLEVGYTASIVLEVLNAVRIPPRSTIKEDFLFYLQ